MKFLFPAPSSRNQFYGHENSEKNLGITKKSISFSEPLIIHQQTDLPSEPLTVLASPEPSTSAAATSTSSSSSSSPTAAPVVITGPTETVETSPHDPDQEMQQQQQQQQNVIVASEAAEAEVDLSKEIPDMPKVD